MTVKLRQARMTETVVTAAEAEKELARGIPPGVIFSQALNLFKRALQQGILYSR